MPTQTSERWIADGNNVKEQLEGEGYTVDLQYANDEIPTQSHQIDQMITEGADILVDAEKDVTALSGQLENEGWNDNPVISYDHLIGATQHDDCSVICHNYQR